MPPKEKLEEPLSPLNENLEAVGALPTETWTEWLWKSNPEEPFAANILMNRCQLLGLLVCRHHSEMFEENPTPPCTDARMTLMSKHPAEMTARELKDTIDNILIEWPQFLHRLRDNPRPEENLRAVVGLVDACFARLGHLASHPAGPETFDDAGTTEPHDAHRLMRFSRPALRRALGAFMVLYRHMHLLARAEPVEPAPSDCGIRKHHMEASNDDFNILCMHMKIPVAARLNYKQDFPGMYNHVSQVVYFHNPQYERSKRVALEEVPAGDAMHVLPAICQLHPDIELTYEEDHVDLSAPTGKWRWMVLPGRIYLVGPDSRVYYDENVTSLLNVYTHNK